MIKGREVSIISALASSSHSHATVQGVPGRGRTALKTIWPSHINTHRWGWGWTIVGDWQLVQQIGEWTLEIRNEIDPGWSLVSK